ncbi:MAG: sugar transferase [Anaerolineae bacterium]|nr:sugar transferase [Candidatus Roseilinea sp.]MDW8451336.1 sugar transferase [Anaerolineae bacterium]
MTTTSILASRLRLEFSERKLLLRLGDLTLIGFGVVVAVAFWSRFAQRPFDSSLLREQLPWVVAIGTGWALCLAVLDMYDLKRAVNVRWCLQRIGLSAVVIGLFYLIYFFINVSPLAVANFDPSPGTTPLRLAPAASVLAIAGLLALWRTGYATVLGSAHARRRVLVLGAGAAGRTITETLRAHPHFEIVGFVDDDPRKHSLRIYDIPVLGGHQRMLDYIESRHIDEIIVAISAQVSGSLFQAIMDCHERGVTITPMPLLYEQLTGKVAVQHIGSQWYVALPFESHPCGTLSRLSKRLLDLGCGAILFVLFLATAPLIALAIKLDSPGPIFYRQERMGMHGKTFTVTKYRSMVQNAECDGQAKWAAKDDPRVTRVGRILRKTRLDELPQVINVLKGEMSMVGPRPERPQFIAQLHKQIPFYRTRLAGKPGLTGWAQVNYGYGATVEDALIKLQYDLYYLKHQSIWFDLKILLKTFAVVFKMRGQ